MIKGVVTYIIIVYYCHILFSFKFCGGRRRRRSRRRYNYGRNRDEIMSGIKIMVPHFQKEKNGESIYLEWETKIEQIFQFHIYSKIQKMQVAVLEFIYYILCIGVVGSNR